MTPDPVVVIADDLSGAAELAGIAFARGHSAEVQREFDASSDAAVIAVDTDSRHLSPGAAAERVERITRAVIARRPAWIYKKVDSVLRGNVRAEIEAILGALATSLAVLIPANPSRGRTFVGGRLLIDGVTLDQTAFRSDPEHPRTTSAVGELLGTSDQIFVPDVGDMADVAQRAARLHASTLPAGAADFFAALLDARGAGQGRVAQSPVPVVLNKPALLVCGSRAAWETREDQCTAAAIAVLKLPGTPDLPNDAIEQATAQLASRGVLALAIGANLYSEVSNRELLPPLAALVARLCERVPIATILAEGGATAAAVAERLAWNRFRVVQSAPAGVGVLQPVDAAAAPLFLIKPGSYAWPDEIWRQIAQPA